MTVFGHTLGQHPIDARKILTQLPNRVSKAAGWELHPVTLVSPHRRSKCIHHTFVDQYTKSSIWTFDQIGIKTVLHLDAGTIVRRNPDELQNLPFGFGAVPDVRVDDPGFAAGSNAGILFHPSTRIFGDTVSKLERADFGLKDAEQSYLNHYCGAESVLLPCDKGGVGGDVEGDAVGYEDRPLYCRQDLRLRNEVPELDVRPNAGVRPEETGSLAQRDQDEVGRVFRSRVGLVGGVVQLGEEGDWELVSF